MLLPFQALSSLDSGSEKMLLLLVLAEDFQLVTSIYARKTSQF